MARNTADDVGIKYIWDKLIAKLATKVDKEAGKGLSANDYTTTEKNKLEGIEAGAQVNPTIDSALSDNSTNAVQNKVVKAALDGKADSGDILGSKSVNGNPIAISDAANAYAEEVIANIEPIQDLHGYDHPWVGGAGKNKFDIEGWLTANNISFTKSGNSYTFSCSGLYKNPFEFSDTDIATNLNSIITIPSGSEASNVGFELVNSSGGSITARSNSWQNKVGNKVRLNYSVGGVIKVDTPIIAKVDADISSYEPYSNICPISGLDSVEVKRTGKNLFDLTQYTQSKIEQGVTFTVNSDGSVSANGTTASTRSQIYWTIPEELAKKFSGMILNGAINSSCIVRFEKAESPWTRYAVDTGEGATIGEIPDGVGNCLLICIVSANTTINGIFYPMIRPASIADSTFEPYQSETHTTPLPQTTYGGTLNVQTGELVVDRASVDLGSLNWINNGTVGSNIEYACDVTDKLYGTTNLSCSCFEVKANAEVYCIRGRVTSNVVSTISTVSNVSDFKASVTGQTLVYELATPIIYQLTPQQFKLLLEHNNISTNADTLDIVYQVNNVLGEILSESEEYADRAIESLDDQYIKNDGVEGNSTNITSYNSTSNPFTTPTDGYIKFSVPLNYTDRYVTVYFLYPDLERIWLIKKIAGNNSYSFQDAIFVKKGTICMVYENSVDASVFFVS